MIYEVISFNFPMNKIEGNLKMIGWSNIACELEGSTRGRKHDSRVFFLARAPPTRAFYRQAIK